MQQKEVTGAPFYTEEPDFSFQQLFIRWIVAVRYVLRHWRLLLPVALAGGLLGMAYAWWKPVTYTARLSFVVEDAKSGSGGGSLVSALSGSLGLDIGGMMGGGSMLSGDNVMALVKSHSILRKTLLTPYGDTGTYSLADKYADTYRWTTAWQRSGKVGRLIRFPAGKTSFTRMEDSLMQTIIKRITEKELSISKPDKKLNFFELQMTLRDELLSGLLCQRLLKTSTDFYVNTKTGRLRGNIDRLQKRADSINLLLNKKTYSSSVAEQLLLDGNPAYAAPTVNSEISSRDKLVLSTIYTEVVKNLEVSKTALVQETPAIQVVDEPEMPLKRNKISWYAGALIGGLLAACLAGMCLLMSKKEE